MPINDVQTTNKQHAVPQNIMDVEFKIIGELTMRQFIYLLIFCGIGYFIYSTGLPAFVKWPLILLLVGSGAGFAFVPVQDRGLDEWIISFFKLMYAPNQMVWRKDPTLPLAFLYQNLSMVKQELITLTPTSSRRKLEEYLDNQEGKVVVDPLDIHEQEYIKMVHDAYANVPQVSTSVTLEEPEVKQEIPPAQEPKKMPENKQIQKLVEQPKPEEIRPQQQIQPIAKVEKPIEQIKLPNEEAYSAPLIPLTPDRHSGRKFTNLLPSEGEIILPIRGERVLQSSFEMEVEEDVAEKAEQLKKLLEQIRGDEAYSKTIKQAVGANQDSPQQTLPKEQTSRQEARQEPIVTPTPKTPEDISSEAQNIVSRLEQENIRLGNEINKLKQELEKSHQPQEVVVEKQETIRKLEGEKQKSTQEYHYLQEKVNELKEKIQKKATEIPSDKVTQNPNLASAGAPTFSNSMPQSNTPNIVSGSVKDSSGKILEGVVVIIKNSRNEPVRALKTNRLGQFSISNPLTNGPYTIEIDKNNLSGQTFDIIKIDVQGIVIPQIEFTGK